jgi:hypothetical protein
MLRSTERCAIALLLVGSSHGEDMFYTGDVNQLPYGDIQSITGNYI